MIQNEKLKSPFHAEITYNSVIESENSVREVENRVLVKLIFLTRLILSKILFHSRYIFHQTSIFILQF